MALDRATLTRILDVRERNAIVALAHHGRGDDARRIAARELGFGRDEFDQLIASAETKITQARMRLAEGFDDTPPRPVEVAALDAAGESVEPERQNGDVAFERDGRGHRKAVHVPRSLELLHEYGPMTQADLRRKLGVQSPVMATVVVPGLRRAGVQFGPERIDRSLMLRLPEHVDSEVGSGQDKEVRQPSNHSSPGEMAGPDADQLVPSNVREHDALVAERNGQWIQVPLDAPDCEFCHVPPGRKHVAVVSPASSAGTAAGSPSGASDDGATKQADAPADDTPQFEEETQPEWGAGDPAERANGATPEEGEGITVHSDAEFRERFGEGPAPFAGIDREEAAWRVLIPPEDEEERRVMYLGILFEQVQKPWAPEHVYDRIERMIGVEDGERQDAPATRD